MAGESHGVAAASRLVTVMFTDIEAHSVWWQSHPDEMSAALERHDRETRDVIAATGGVLVKHTGDGVMAVYDDPTAAVAGAVQLLRAMAAPGWPLELRIAIGLHAGMTEHRDADWFGVVPITAARLCAAAHGRQVLATSAVVELTPAAAWLDLGTHRLRGIARPVHVHQLDTGDRIAFPPLRGTERGGDIPVNRTSFVGRDRVVADVTEAVRQHRLVTVTGAGGVGKTRLALEVARAVEDASVGAGRFVDLSLADEARGVAATVAAALRIDPDLDQIALASRLCAVVDASPTLLVLDNCEHVVDDAAALVELLLDGAPSCRILATSREPLGNSGERIWPLGGLDPDDGLRLFRDRAIDVASGEATSDDDEIVRRICHRLDHLPLAIELAAARAGQIGVAEIERLLDDRFRLLTGGGRRPARQRTLESTLDWSYDLLDPADQALLRHLAVFAGPFTLGVAAELLGLDELEALDGIARLADKSLLVHRGDRWGMLETVADYAMHRLLDAGEAVEWRTRHREVWLARLERPPTDQVVLPSDVSAALADDWPDLRASVRWSIDRGEWPIAARLVELLPGTMALSRSAEGVGWVAEVGRHLERGSAAWYANEFGRLRYAIFGLHVNNLPIDRVSAGRGQVFRDLGERAASGSDVHSAFDLALTSMMGSGYAFVARDRELQAQFARWAASATERLRAANEPSLFRTYGLVVLAERLLSVEGVDASLAIAEAAVLPPAGCDDASAWSIVGVMRLLAGRDDAADAAKRSIGRPALLPARMFGDLVLAVDAARHDDRARCAEHLAAVVSTGRSSAVNWSWVAVLAGVGTALELDDADRAARWFSGMRPNLMASIISEVFALRNAYGSDPRLNGRLRGGVEIPREQLLAEVADFADSLR